MNICICSLFRDSATRRNGEIHRYFQRIINLLDKNIRYTYSFVEGDSIDETYAVLQSWAKRLPAKLEKSNLNKPHYGSIVHPERFEQLSILANKAVDNAQQFDPDYYLWLESDLIFRPDLVRQLLVSAENLQADMVAPLIMVEPPDNRFYDTFAFIDFMQRANFINNPPYHPNLDLQKPMRMYSIGSVMLIRKSVIEADVRWQPKNCIVDFCADAVHKGFSIWLDPRIVVYHPKV